MPVTNENKILYLNLLAQYRLANQVREEVEHFLKGNAQNMIFAFFFLLFFCFSSSKISIVRLKEKKKVRKFNRCFNPLCRLLWLFIYYAALF